jgi:hypothetical protein
MLFSSSGLGVTQNAQSNGGGGAAPSGVAHSTRYGTGMPGSDSAGAP